jgi:ASC-1-like (ASCH) protein
MLLIRETMFCKPGKARPMIEKFLAMSKLNEKMKMPKMRVLTDFASDRYWTVVAEMEVPNLKAFEDMMSGMGANANDPNMKEMENLMKGYHDLVDHGRREIFKIEG